jgi:cytoskeleton protein RodZ
VSLRLIGAEGSSWVQVTGKGRRQLFSGILRKGETEDFTDKEIIKLVVGNAGAVRLVVNGKDLGAPGREGAVFRNSFGPGDVQGGAG